jgi:hypothetical protein
VCVAAKVIKNKEITLKFETSFGMIMRFAVPNVTKIGLRIGRFKGFDRFRCISRKSECVR